MLSKFYPDIEADSVYKIDFKELYKQGYRGIIFDIDNTLVPHGAPADDKVKEFFEKLRSLGYETLLLSNNKEPRVKSFAEDVNSKYIYKGGKPARSGYEKAMASMETTKENTLFVGDQLFTDVWGAKRTGIRNILVKPIHPKEEIQIVLKRKLEKVVLHFYRKHMKSNNK